MISPAELTGQIIEAVRTRAKDFDFDLDTAAIRIAIEPIADEAREWIQPVVPESAMRYEVVAKIRPNNQCTSEMYECACSDGMTALKITNCIRNVLFKLGNSSRTPQNDARDYIHPGNGLANYDGCVSCLISKEIFEGHDHPDTIQWARVYVSVGGGHQKDDELCALYGIAAISKALNYTEYTTF